MSGLKANGARELSEAGMPPVERGHACENGTLLEGVGLSPATVLLDAPASHPLFSFSELSLGRSHRHPRAGETVCQQRGLWDAH